MHFNRLKNQVQKGFTLVELLVVLVLMSLITLVFLNQQGKFDSSTIMRSLAYSIALSVRQTQVYGISVLENGGQFSSAYGLYFTQGAPGQYILYADANSNGTYDSGTDSTIKVFTLSKTYTIAELCAQANVANRCSGADDSVSAGSLKSMSIYFKRPNPDAQITALQADGTPFAPGGEAYSNAYVEIQALDGDVRVIKVSSTGQISVCGGTINMAQALQGSC